MANSITVKFDEEGDMAEAVEILKTMNLPIRSIMREAVIKEARKWAYIANEVNKGVSSNDEQKQTN